MVFQINAGDDWKKLGALDPYYGVLSDFKFKSQNITDVARAEFFDSGVAHVDKVFQLLKDIFGFVPRGTALDYGCGVGRITNALSGHFDQVIGLDISAGMLDEARRMSTASGKSNIRYEDSATSHALKSGSCDLVHTYIVLQHIPPSLGEEIILSLISAVKVGGCGAIHFTYADSDPPLKSKLRHVIKTTAGLRHLANIAKGRKWNYPAMQMNNYSLARILKIFEEAGVPNMFISKVDDWGNLGVFVFFKKQDAPVSWSNRRNG